MLIGQIAFLFYAYKKYWGMNRTFDIEEVKFKTYFLYTFGFRQSSIFLNSFLRSELEVNLYLTLGVQAVIAIALTVQRPFKKKWMNVFMLINEYILASFLTLNVVSSKIEMWDSSTVTMSWTQVFMFAGSAGLMITCLATCVIEKFFFRNSDAAKIHPEDETKREFNDE